MDLTLCRQKYTRSDVENLIEYSEEKHGAPDPGAKTQTTKPLFATTASTSKPDLSVTFTTSSDKGTGHAMARHLKVNNFGLKTRTMDPSSGGKSKDGMRAQGIDQASSFVKGDEGYKDLITVITRLLNSARGQDALAYCDLYRHHGKARFAIVETAAKLGCAGMTTRVFYKDGATVQEEVMQSAALVVDSNIGGKYPLKIVTAFPCKADASLELGMPDVMMQARDARKELADPAKAYAELCKKFIRKKHTNVDARVVRARIGKHHLVVGTPFGGSGWIKPNSLLFELQNAAGGAQPLVAEKFYSFDTLKETFLAERIILWEDASERSYLIPFQA